ncbi:S41 family peptidase [Capnocytophaga ochracea]|uniref:S41 family peptidase n=1 Tax=Capnocytophaga ochracea TaxID=1018 RepID=UPI002B46D276|nr:S41 family peptidase [Capnocytophaga ochracea]MEB3037089.1 S41 family peptidase [Capnocytophaga ochracea]
MKHSFISIFIAISLLSCAKEPVTNGNEVSFTGSDYTGNDTDLRVRDFIWKGLNTYYLWQADVPNLQNNRFGTLADTKADKNRSYTEFLRGFTDPKKLFYNGLLNRYEEIDRFSYITDNYTDLENQFKGITASVGVNYAFGLAKKLGVYFLYVRYVVPNSEAERQGLQRGDVILSINNITLTEKNRLILLQKTPIINFTTYRFLNQKFQPTGKTYTLHQAQTPENPVFIHKVFNKGGKKIAYLMYNAFTADFDEALNDAFADFKAQGATDLILDLRYNGGGSVDSATYLASMITGQFNGQVFAIEKWNSKLQPFKGNEREYFTSNMVKGSRQVAINSLRLNKVYVITSDETASASELVINGLKAYIDVVQIGETTMGKNQGSVTVYDFTDKQRKVKNPNHKWAMQPLVMKIENAKGVGDYVNGLEPNIQISEIVNDLGVLGDETEPLLARTLQEITGNVAGRASRSASKETFYFEKLGTSTSGYFGLNEMYK